MSRTLFPMALIALAVATGFVWLPLLTTPAVDSFVMSPGFTAFAMLSGIVVAISPVLALAFIIHDARSSGRSEPEGGK